MTFDLTIELCREKAWTVGDELALDALPDDTKELVARAIRCRQRSMMFLTRDGKSVSLSDAFEEGWEAAMDEVSSSIDRRAGLSNPYRDERGARR